MIKVESCQKSRQILDVLCLLNFWGDPVPRAGTGSRVTGSVIMSGSGLGSKLFSYRPGISTRYLPEQRNDTASVYMLGTHERIVQSRGSMRPLTQSNKRELIASQLAQCPAAVSSRGRPWNHYTGFHGQALYDDAVFKVH